jgi:hypothetical protein
MKEECFMKEEIIINTLKGKIKARKGLDSAYPSIDVLINDELAAVVEFSPAANNFLIHVYEVNKNEPVSSFIFDGLKNNQ